MKDPIHCVTEESLKKMEPDLIQFCGYDGPGWYFTDETESFVHGPFNTREEALENLKNYAKELTDELDR